MKINKNISFGKTLVATCQIPTTDKNSCSWQIYEINNKDDKDYFERISKSPKWNGNKFLWVMKRLMQSNSIGKDNDTYSLETNSGECLGYINIISHKIPLNKKSIQYLESSQEDTKDKKAQQTLIAFIVEQAKKENRNEVSTLAFDKTTRRFFSKECGFKHSLESDYDFKLLKKSYDKFLKNYKEKTGNKITFIK